MSQHQIQEQQNNQVAGFIAKTFEILSNQQFTKIAYWSPSGLQFIIKDINKFQQIVLPRYFRHNKMNSFIRQLNMYGFHKSRADHTKSVFSHPSFIRGRDDLLITIKRKIKGKGENRVDQVEETPMKKINGIQNKSTATKEPEIQNQILSFKHMMSTFEQNQHYSFNMLGTKQRLGSLLNFNISIPKISQAAIDQIQHQNDDNDSCASIEEKIDMRQEITELDKIKSSFRFINPSCFFDSMKKHL